MSSSLWKCIGTPDDPHPEVENDGDSCRVLGCNQERVIKDDFDVRTFVSQLYQSKQFLVGGIFIGLICILGGVQFCGVNSRTQSSDNSIQEKELYYSAIALARDGFMPGAIEKLCKLPAESQYFKGAQSWVKKWYLDEYWHANIDLLLKEQDSSCPVADEISRQL